MPNYLPKQSFTVNKFNIDIYPFLNPPENPKEEGVALQYGADFKVSFNKGLAAPHNIGILQLILPSTPGPFGKTVGQWSVDKRGPANEAVTLAKALYGADGTLIDHSDYYKDQPMRNLSHINCSIIDTPRDMQGGFNQAGVFESEHTTTKFANYIVEMTGQNGKIYDGGLQWGYVVAQDAHDVSKFSWTLTEPKAIQLSKTNEHLNAIASFLGIKPDVLKTCIS
jgi:hypothetical protein